MHRYPTARTVPSIHRWLLCGAVVAVHAPSGLTLPRTADESRPRLRDLGLGVGEFKTGSWNAITDVPGVRVGHCTIREEGALCTGVTAILPHAGNVFRDKVRAGCFTGNGFGKLVGTTQVQELGTLETPILLTGTLSTFRVADALISWVLDHPENGDVRSVNPVVGETNDGWLSDIRRRPVEEHHVRTALETASDGPVALGCVGAGSGTLCLGFKGGIGTASRVLALGRGESAVRGTVGVLVQTNFGGALRFLGAPIAANELRNDQRGEEDDGSCMVVVATDLPLDARQLNRLSRRAVFALGRVGASYSHGSGDYAISFTTERATSDARIDDAVLSPLFAATLDAVEEAVLDSMLKATTTTGFRGRRMEAVAVERLVEVCRARGLPARLPD